jgi:tetratricopeptide (TPR) repeat protein
MRFLRKILATGRLRRAQKDLAERPSPSAYIALAAEYVCTQDLDEALAILEEGAAAFPGHPELGRELQRARAQAREERLAELRQLTSTAPRPALLRELVDVLREAGQSDKAEETAGQWVASGGGGEALLALAEVQVERYFTDRGRTLGLSARETLRCAASALPGDPRPLELELGFLVRVGAYPDALAVASMLLQLLPGDARHEARHRWLASAGRPVGSVEQALREVERTGRFPGEAQTQGGTARDVRPELTRLAAEAGAQASVYVRGSTALVHGQRGAAAERCARAVRAVGSGGRTAARRLGLGQASAITVEGDHGVLRIAMGEMDAAALWSLRGATPAQLRTLSDIVGQLGPERVAA